MLFDAVPPFTQLSEIISCPSLGALPSGITACTVITPTSTNNVVGYEDNIKWELSGTLPSGESGEVTYRVKVK